MHAAIFGFGNLGRAILAALATRASSSVGAIVDTAPGLAGASTASVFPAGGDRGTILPSLPPADQPTVLFHASTSEPARATAEIIAALEASSRLPNGCFIPGCAMAPRPPPSTQRLAGRGR